MQGCGARCAEVAGVALSVQLASDVSYLLWIPMVAFAVWMVIWKVSFSILENVFGILGLALFAFTVHAPWLRLRFTSPFHPLSEVRLGSRCTSGVSGR